MKKFALALSALMVLNVAAMAADTTATVTKTTTTAKSTKTTKSVKHEKVVTPSSMKAAGEVVSVDAVANTLTIKGKKADETFAVAASAKITSGKKEAKLADVAAGSKVVVTYTKDGSTMTASAVKIVPAMKKASKKAKATAPAAAPAK